MNDSLYNTKKEEAENVLKQLLDEANDLKVSYNYSEIKSSNIPFLLQEQIQLIDRMSLSKNMKNEWAISDIKNNGHFMALMQDFDTFEKKDIELREQATMILSVERAVARANDYLKTHIETLPGVYPLIENKELFTLAHDYLIKAQKFSSFDKQSYRTALIKQAILSNHIPAEKIAQDIKNKVIKISDVKDLPQSILNSTPKIKENYENIYNTVIAPAFPDLKKVAVKDKEKYMIKVVGTTFSNENGEKRQDILKELQQGTLPCKADLVKDTFKGKPSIAVVVNEKQIGFVPQSTANAIIDSYPDNKLEGEITNVTGGFEQRKQDGTVDIASFGADLKVLISLDKNKTEDKSKDKPVEMADAIIQDMAEQMAKSLTVTK